MSSRILLKWDLSPTAKGVDGIKIFRVVDSDQQFEEGGVSDTDISDSFASSGDLLETLTPLDTAENMYLDESEKPAGNYKYGVFSYNTVGLGPGWITQHTVS